MFCNQMQALPCGQRSWARSCGCCMPRKAVWGLSHQAPASHAQAQTHSLIFFALFFCFVIYFVCLPMLCQDGLYHIGWNTHNNNFLSRLCIIMRTLCYTESYPPPSNWQFYGTVLEWACVLPKNVKMEQCHKQMTKQTTGVNFWTCNFGTRRVRAAHHRAMRGPSRSNLVHRMPRFGHRSSAGSANRPAVDPAPASGHLVNVQGCLLLSGGLPFCSSVQSTPPPPQQQ